MNTLNQPGYHGQPHAAWAPGTLEWAVLEAGAHLPGAAQRWDLRRAQGLDDAGLADALAAEMGGVLTLVCQGPRVWCIGGPEPRLWLRAAPAGPPTLHGRELAQYARKVFDVPGRGKPQGRLF